jgi:hypothetical protein
MFKPRSTSEVAGSNDILMKLWRNDGCMMGCGLFVVGTLALLCIGNVLASGFIKP